MISLSVKIGEMLIALITLILASLPVTSPHNNPYAHSINFSSRIGPQGEFSPPSKFPFIVALKTREGSPFCTGSIVSHSWVITARHCLRYQTILIMPGTVEINCDTEGAYRVIKLVLHHKTPFYSDIGLVKVERPFEFSPLVKVIELGIFHSEDPFVGIGFGLIVDKQSPGLRYVEIRALKEGQFCETDEYKICAVAASDQHQVMFGGDSGGPLVDMKTRKLVGVQSTRNVESAQLIRVDAFFEWIAEYVDDFDIPLEDEYFF